MMTVSRTPLRVSFFGGGTDYPEYFAERRGAVLGMAIDQYVYVAALRLTNMLDYRYRISYSRMEQVASLDAIEHPVVREAIRHYGFTHPLDISIMADLPARSGLGSSSSFTVGFLNLLFELLGRRVTKMDLAREAVQVERGLLGENVGVQDQHHAAFGGLNRFDFRGGRTRISPIQMTGPCQAALTSSLFLVYTGITRFASATLDEQMAKTKSGASDADLSHLLTLVDQAQNVLEGDDPESMLTQFGAMLHEGWETKKRLSSKVSSPGIDALYDKARAAGSLGGKLCGAGSGGFLLMLVPEAAQSGFRSAMKDHALIPVGLDTSGATILRG
jgi:D-glycero-alpha-D-manno-heptose-7-phosphate kinase